MFDDEFPSDNIFVGISTYSDDEVSEILDIYSDDDYIIEPENEMIEDSSDEFLIEEEITNETEKGFFSWIFESEATELEGPVIAGELDEVSYDEEFIAYDIDEIEEWIDDINPNYNPYDLNENYENNCGSCSFAVFNRLEGNDNVTATENNIGYNEQMEDITGLTQESMSPTEIEDYLTDLGAGAHGIVGIDRAQGPGHWFNAYFDGEEVYAIDGQTGEVQNWPPDYGNVVNWELSVIK